MIGNTLNAQPDVRIFKLRQAFTTDKLEKMLLLVLSTVFTLACVIFADDWADCEHIYIYTYIYIYIYIYMCIKSDGTLNVYVFVCVCVRMSA